MYFNITTGNINISDITSLNKYKIENHSQKQKGDSKYFDVYKIIEGKNFIWLRVEKKTGFIRSFKSLDTVNEYQFIIDFLELKPDLKIADEIGEPMNIEVVKELKHLKDKILKLKK